MPDYNETISSLRQLQQLKQTLQMYSKRGIISEADAASQILMTEKQEQKLVKQLINQVHVTNGGVPRRIKYVETKGLWYTQMADKSKIYAKTEDGLYRKLFTVYGLTVCDTSIRGVFESALAEKSRTENNNESTIKRYRYSFDRFISKEMAGKDIRNISKSDLKAHTQEMVNRLHPKKKAFLTYKGLLNLIFGYAVEYDIIPANPVSVIQNAVYLKSCDTKTATPEEKILSEAEIGTVKATVRKYMEYKRYHGYFINGYAILFSIETGVRIGEIPALKWEDVYANYIHIHAQQLYHERPAGKEYYYVPWTKDEKGISRGGRKYPLTDAIKAILTELRDLQEQLGIRSEYIFCHENGDWIKKDAYVTCLRRLMKSLSMPVINNHAFRMSLNSNVLIGKCDLPVTERARLLGHSVETNLRHYSFAGKDNMNELQTLLNQQVSPWSHQNLVKFRIKKSPESTKFKAL
ncbi:MAG: tyrosine-type recombinase/integrase [Lachnospiraceae bacterium]|nr:tyrosine-type recombinase/integrase [Lachnospiraceae bacterium]